MGAQSSRTNIVSTASPSFGMSIRCFTNPATPAGATADATRSSFGSCSVSERTLSATICTVSIRFTTYFLEVFENIWDKIWRN